ncbi:hypothetical protein PV326_009100 [Microctonus aethiopoides]|nr:hypothetical protein PV326_009100 [Microctonus aethiopoides]
MKKVQEQDKEDEPPLYLVSSMRQKLRVGGLQGSATRYVMHLIECSAAMFEPIKPHEYELGKWGWKVFMVWMNMSFLFGIGSF